MVDNRMSKTFEKSDGGVKIVGFGNPLLDIIANMSDDELEKFKLAPGGYSFWDSNRHAALYPLLMSKPEVKFVPGGSTQNTVRVAQALIDVPFTCGYVGATGDDEYRGIMERLNLDNSLMTFYQKVPSLVTGVCGVCLNSGDRAMVTHLGAAEKFPDSSFDTPEIKQLIDNASIIVSECYWLTVNAARQLSIAQRCRASGKIFATNLSAGFIVRNYFDQMARLITSADVITGNVDEWIAYYEMKEKKSWPQNASEAETYELLGATLQTVCDVGYKPMKNGFPRIVVCTRGCMSTLVAFRDEDLESAELESYQVSPVPPHLIVDVNAAGDAFLGGLLAGILEDSPLERCIELAHMAGREVIMNHGALFDFGYYLKGKTSHYNSSQRNAEVCHSQRS